jgi:parvulin-like peptidyl-prolyl isomerase
MTVHLRGRRCPGARVLPWLLLSAVLLSCSEFGDSVVARSGSDRLTVRDLRLAYANTQPLSRPPLNTRRDRLAFLNQVLDHRLLLDHGRALVAANDLVPDAAYERGRMECLVQRLLTLEGEGWQPNESDVEEAYRRMQFSSRVQRLVFASDEAARAAAVDLEAGKTFAEISRRAEAYRPSDRWVTWVPWRYDALSNAAIDLEVGEVSGPFFADMHDQIIRVDERRPEEQPELEEIASRISEGLRTRRRARRAGELQDELWAAAKVQLVPDTIELLTERTRTAVLTEDPEIEGGVWANPVLSEKERELPLAVAEQGVLWTVKDYLETTARSLTVRGPRRGSAEAEIRQLCRREVGRRLLLAEAERRGLEKDWWARKTLERLEEEWLIRSATADIHSHAGVQHDNVDSLITLLQATQPGLFRRQEGARVIRFDLPSREAALDERERIERAGGAAARLAQLLDGDLEFEGLYHVVWIPRGALALPDIESELFDRGPGRLVGPFQVGTQWVIAEAGQITPAEEMSAEEVRADVLARLTSSGTTTRVQEWIEQRREELHVRIDENALDELRPGI